jgi:hypothetical protein
LPSSEKNTRAFALRFFPSIIEAGGYWTFWQRKDLSTTQAFLTGIVGYPKNIHQLDNKMWEAPVSTFKLTKFDVGLGGAYFRILPYPIFKYKFRQINKERSGIFYIHPWELDPAHPYLASLPKRIRLPHYFNLGNTEKKIEKLLNDFEFIPLIDIINKKAILL